MLGICLALIDEPSDKEKFEYLYNTYKDMMSKLAMSIMHNEELVKETVKDCGNTHLPRQENFKGKAGGMF